jgi:hypothetical protein
MWVFISLLCVIGAAFTVAKISLPERKRYTLALAAGVAVLCLACIGPATRINLQGLSIGLNRLDTLSNLCTVLIVESLAMFLIVGRLMEQHEDHRAFSFCKALAFVPSCACLAGLFVLMVLLFNTLSGISFFRFGGLYTLGAAAVLGGGAVAARRLVRDWNARLELVLLLAFVQLVLAMFLPLVARGVTTPSRAGDHPLWAVPLAMALSLACAVPAFAIRKVSRLLMGDHARWTF